VGRFLNNSWALLFLLIELFLFCGHRFCATCFTFWVYSPACANSLACPLRPVPPFGFLYPCFLASMGILSFPDHLMLRLFFFLLPLLLFLRKGSYFYFFFFFPRVRLRSLGCSIQVRFVSPPLTTLPPFCAPPSSSPYVVVFS